MFSISLCVTGHKSVIVRNRIPFTKLQQQRKRHRNIHSSWERTNRRIISSVNIQLVNITSDLLDKQLPVMKFQDVLVLRRWLVTTAKLLKSSFILSIREHRINNKVIKQFDRRRARFPIDSDNTLLFSINSLWNKGIYTRVLQRTHSAATVVLYPHSKCCFPTRWVSSCLAAWKEKCTKRDSNPRVRTHYGLNVTPWTTRASVLWTFP